MKQPESAKLSIVAETVLQQHLEGPRVLVVDDEAVVADICTRALANCRVSKATNGRQALELINNHEFDLVLTDVNMPDMGGLDLLRAIKDLHPNQPVIIMTGYACKDTLLEALQADADDFINKPFNLLQLQTLVNKTLEKKALKEELLQLKRLDRLKTDFLGMISDKLNNPVTAISLFFQSIGQGTIDLADPAFQEYLELVGHESDNLVKLIHSLLLYSDLVLDDSPLERAPVDLCRLAREVVIEAQQQLDHKSMTLVTDCPSKSQPIPLDRKRIMFVIRALIDNAINACSTGDSIHIGLTSDDSTVTLTITDPGIGIPVAEQKKVFEKFYQAESATPARSKGFGLGLYYALMFTRMHDGTLTLKSAPGCGTAVAITLPR